MANYNLIFQGEIIAGASLEEVKANVARLFKADAIVKAVKIETQVSPDTVEQKTEPDQSREATPVPPSTKLSSGLASLISYNQAVRNDETVKNDNKTKDITEEEGLQLTPLGSYYTQSAQ